jgi:hypothetical protein
VAFERSTFFFFSHFLIDYALGCLMNLMKHYFDSIMWLCSNHVFSWSLLFRINVMDLISWTILPKKYRLCFFEFYFNLRTILQGYVICNCLSGLRFKVLICNLWFRCFINLDLSPTFTLKGPSCVIIMSILTLSYVFLASCLNLGTALQGLFIQWLCNSQLLKWGKA